MKPQFCNRDVVRYLSQQILAEAGENMALQGGNALGVLGQESLDQIPIIEHLAEGRPKKQSDEARLEETRFNYHAGIVAQKAPAMENANHFFHQCENLYPHKENLYLHKENLYLHKD